MASDCILLPQSSARGLDCDKHESNVSMKSIVFYAQIVCLHDLLWLVSFRNVPGLSMPRWLASISKVKWEQIACLPASTFVSSQTTSC
jgi:hypothetical protein